MRRIDIKRNLEIIALLNENKYVLGRKIGEGYNREAYEVIHKKNSLQKLMVAKIYKKETATDSIQHRINQTKGLKEKELEILSSILHPNIIQIQDVLAKESIFITIEEYFDAISLEDRIKIYGPILNHELFKQIFSQVSDALSYLHVNKKLLHRDIKPQNILLGRQMDIVKLTDFQNATKMEDISLKLFPTRGGTQYTHPNLLNSLLFGEKNNADLSTEFYALGITMYQALAGKLPFDFRLKIDSNGRDICIDGEEIGVSLSDGDTELGNINQDYHEKKLEKKLLEVPERYRRLLSNCLSLEKRYYGISDPALAHERFKEDFKYVTTNRGSIIIDIGKIKPLVSLKPKEKADDYLQAIIGKYARLVISFGKRDLKADSYSEGHGSDAIRASNSTEKYLLKQGKFEFIVEDMHYYHSGGTWTAIWCERYNSKFIINYEGKRLIVATRVLGGDSGDVIEPDKISKFEPNDWYIEKVWGFKSLPESLKEQIKSGFIPKALFIGDFESNEDKMLYKINMRKIAKGQEEEQIKLQLLKNYGVNLEDSPIEIIHREDGDYVVKKDCSYDDFEFQINREHKENPS